MPNKKYDKFYTYILIGIAVLSLTGNIGTYIKPVFISRLEAAEKDIRILNSQYTRIDAKLDKIIWTMKK